jgi:hypothetical protein
VFGAGLGELGAIRSDLGVCPQRDCLWPELTVAEHLHFYAKVKGVPAAEEAGAGIQSRRSEDHEGPEVGSRSSRHSEELDGDSRTDPFAVDGPDVSPGLASFSSRSTRNDRLRPMRTTHMEARDDCAPPQDKATDLEPTQLNSQLRHGAPANCRQSEN